MSVYDDPEIPYAVPFTPALAFPYGYTLFGRDEVKSKVVGTVGQTLSL